MMNEEYKFDWLCRCPHCRTERKMEAMPCPDRENVGFTQFFCPNCRVMVPVKGNLIDAKYNTRSGLL